MKIALISDIHDNAGNLVQALSLAEAAGCTHLICLGDMVHSSTFRTLRTSWAFGIDLVFGNNERERSLFRRMAESFTNTTLHGDTGELELEGRRIFITHMPERAQNALAARAFDAVFFGHTHLVFNRTFGHTLVANPGEITGRGGNPTFGIYDTESNTVSIRELVTAPDYQEHIAREKPTEQKGGETSNSESPETGGTHDDVSFFNAVKGIPPIKVEYQGSKPETADGKETPVVYRLLFEKYFREHLAGKQIQVGTTGYSIEFNASRNSSSRAANGVNSPRRMAAGKALEKALEIARHVGSSPATHREGEGKKRKNLIDRCHSFERFACPIELNGKPCVLWVVGTTLKNGEPTKTRFYEFGIIAKKEGSD